MKKKIVGFLLVSVTLLGCTNQLDIDPFNTIDESQGVSTSGDVEALLVGAYNALGDGDVYGGNLLRDSELLGDDFDNPELFWDGTFVDPGEIWTKQILITNGQVENTYLDAYAAINICNTVLANLDIVEDGIRDRVEGEAKFIRGTLFFELVRMYARTYSDGDPSVNPGIILVFEPNSNELLERSTVEETYDQIISDLSDAKALLPGSNGFFATTYAASAMLSRVYLMQNDYASARDEANTVIASGEYALTNDYASNFNNESNGSGPSTSEDIFSIQVTSQDGVNNMNTFFASADFGGRGDIYIEPLHFSLYEGGDERLDLFYDGERTGKWNNQFGNVNIIRLSEMYLTRAEANFRLGTSVGDTPLDDLNEVRNRVGLADLGSITSVDQILSERHLELAFEGHRIHDLKRTQSSVGSFPFDAPELIYPIPFREIQINPLLEQNEGY